MSRVDELIEKFCPNGVEFRELQELFTTKGGYTPSKGDASAWADGTVPWFRMEDIRENGRILGDSMQRINKNAVKGGRLFPANSILVATSATIGEHALITVPHLSNQRFTSLTLKPTFTDVFDTKFIFYYCYVLDEWCRNNTTTSSFSSVDMAGFKKFKFPVPPLEVQREIVRILDQFTQLEAELEAELEARRRQYDHYRRKVMAPRSHWTPERLGGVVEFENAKAHERLVDPAGDVTLLTAGFISAGAPKARFVRSEDVLTPALLEDVALVMSDLPNGRALARAFFVDKKDKYAANQRVCLLRPISSNHLDARFLYYTVDRNSQLLAYDSGVDQTHLKKGWILDIQIGIPPVEEQKKIAKMLDKFDALVNDLSVGLPAELAARRKQYEYYRDQMLTFKEIVA